MRYELDGTKLVMVVEHSAVIDIAWPIVADPRISWSWGGINVYLSRWETKVAIDAGIAVAGVHVGGPYPYRC